MIEINKVFNCSCTSVKERNILIKKILETYDSGLIEISSVDARIFRFFRSDAIDYKGVIQSTYQIPYHSISDLSVIKETANRSAEFHNNEFICYEKVDGYDDRNGPFHHHIATIYELVKMFDGKTIYEKVNVWPE